MHAHPRRRQAICGSRGRRRAVPKLVADAGRTGAQRLSPSARRNSDTDVPFRILSTATPRCSSIGRLSSGEYSSDRQKRFGIVLPQNSDGIRRTPAICPGVFHCSGSGRCSSFHAQIGNSHPLDTRDKTYRSKSTARSKASSPKVKHHHRKNGNALQEWVLPPSDYKS